MPLHKYSSHDVKPNMNKQFDYIKNGILAENHTPIYKMHKYFARRPHNVFRHLIEYYTKPGDIVLDCFCGGGVTLVEGLATDRKVIAVDSNPLATFVSDCQTTPINISEYEEIMNVIESNMRKEIGRFYSTKCRKTGKPVEIRWMELAYKAKCKECGQQTLLSNKNKAENEGKPVNGKYDCSNCKSEIVAVKAERTGYEIVAVTYRSPINGERVTVEPNNEDKELLAYFEGKKFNQLIKENDLWYPNDKIPSDWDRQQEDCLHRKSITHFSDFYTKRSLYANAYFLKEIQRYKGKIDNNLYKILLFTFSAVLRYTNNMTVSTGNWMDGRPVAWAKHAFWVPNQFVEVNPLEYIQMRRDAIVSGLSYQKELIPHSSKVNDYHELRSGQGSHIIWTQSSDKLDLPDSSVDAVITDPPYGSNVQYGELCHYWLVWLQNDLNLSKQLFSLESEVLVNRKSKKKNYDDYQDGMTRIFNECFRVLKPSGVLTFTFNNKDIRAWYAVIKAAIKAGFDLEPAGVIYQDPIENYKNTAHTRFAGTVHGDFIYTFKKDIAEKKVANAVTMTKDELISAIYSYVSKNNLASTSELYMICIQKLIPLMVHKAKMGSDQFSIELEEMYLSNIDGFLSDHLTFDSNSKKWQLLTA